MSVEVSENSEVLVRVLVLAVPTVITFLFAVISILISKKKCENAGLEGKELASAAMLFLAICITNLFYMIVEVLFVLMPDYIPIIRLVSEGIFVFELIGLLNALSCLVKGIISAKFLPIAVGENKQEGLSKALIFMSFVELPGLAALVVFLIKFMVN